MFPNLKTLFPSGDYLVTALCYNGSILVAACMYWTSPLVNWLSSDDSSIRLSSIQTDWIISAFEVSCLISVIPLAYLVNKIGRKMTLLIANPVAIASFIIAIFAKSAVAILIARLLQGVSLGVLLTVGPEYAGETLRSEVRGFVISGFNATSCIGALFFSIIGTYLSYTTYCIICLIFPLLGCILILVVPESPHFLIMKNDREKAVESLKWLRGTNDVEDEMNTIERNVREEMTQPRGYKHLLRSPEERRTLTIGLVITIASSIIGYPVIPTYAFNLFPASISSAISSTNLGFIINGVNAFSTIFVIIFIERLGRRPLFLISALGNAVSSLACAFYLLFEDQLPFYMSYLLLAFVILFTFFIAFIQSLQVVAQAELFTSNTRSESAVILQFSNALFSLGLLVIYPVINEYCGISINFFLFFLYSVLFLIYLWFYMPETTGQFIGHKVDRKK